MSDDYVGLPYEGDDYDDCDAEECDECAGEGWIVDDCDEDCCCCLNPEIDHRLVPCPTCNPKGDK